jgi:hypothetical protein
VSTAKAWEVLGAGQHRIIEEHDARKERFDEQAVWDLAKRFHSLVITKGIKMHEKSFNSLDYHKATCHDRFRMAGYSRF